MKYKIDQRITPFIKDILFPEDKRNREHRLPIYADGYPGIVYSQTKNDVILKPSNKNLSDFYLFGQTIEPIELVTAGPYKMVVFQLYPFATRILLGVDPKKLNDDCFDLKKIQSVNTNETISRLKASDTENQIRIISDYTNLTNVAYDNNFSDHSHFIRSFKRYTGHTPKEILDTL
jgi:hypothetical protein